MEKPRLTRLTNILLQLQSRQLVTAQSLANKYDVSIRTIYRDIKTLERSGVPITTIEGKGYQLMEGYQLPPVMFSEAEANALITAEKFMQQNKDQSLVENYQTAITKIKAVLRPPQKVHTALLAERIQVRTNQTKERNSNYLIQLQSAITQYQSHRMVYRSLQEHTTERIIDPFALFHTKENWVLVAFCQKAKDYRSFRLDRIQKLKSINQHFTPHNMTLQGYFEHCRKKYASTLDIPLTPGSFTFVLNQRNSTMEKVIIEPFKVIGIAVRTEHGGGKATKDIPALWKKFMGESIATKIPNKVNNTVYAVYTKYDGDHLNPYTMVLGCQVSSLDSVPEEMVAVNIQGGTYSKYIAQGDVTSGMMYGVWENIWKVTQNRNYQTDFEVYGPKAADPKNAEVEVLVGISH